MDEQKTCFSELFGNNIEEFGGCLGGGFKHVLFSAPIGGNDLI